MPFFVFEILAVDRQRHFNLPLPTTNLTGTEIGLYAIQGILILFAALIGVLFMRLLLFIFRWWAAGTDEEGKNWAKTNLVQIRNYILVLALLSFGLSFLQNVLTYGA